MPSMQPFKYRNYVDAYWFSLIEPYEMRRCISHYRTRHTCISLLTEAKVDPTMIKKIVSRSSALSLTERVYTHLDDKH